MGLIKGKIKNVDKLVNKDISERAALKSSWSGWYVPKDDTFIYFDYANHANFMYEYWYRESRSMKGEYNVMEPARCASMKKLFKKYAEKIKKYMGKKGNQSATYPDFYHFGWLRINVQTGLMTITHNDVDDKYIKNFVLWASKMGIKITKRIEIFNTKTKNTTNITPEEYENYEAVMNNKNLQGDLIDKVRTHMFGPGVYTDEKITFMDFVSYLLSEGI